MVFRSSDTLRVEGLADFRRDLKGLENAQEIEREMARDFQRAAQNVVTAATARAAGMGRREARLARSFKASRSAQGARVTLGGPGHPDAMGAEFGGRGRPRTMQFRQHAGKTGLVLFPTIRDKSDDTMEIAGEGFDRATRRAFPDRS